jgi:hypothetical protein
MGEIPYACRGLEPGYLKIPRGIGHARLFGGVWMADTK